MEEVGFLAKHVVWCNLSLDYIKFVCSGRFWIEAFVCSGRYWNEAFVCIWKRRGTEPMHLRLEEALVRHRSPDVDDEEEEPEEFWSESRKVLSLAGVDLLRR